MKFHSEWHNKYNKTLKYSAWLFECFESVLKKFHFLQTSIS
jgi:hypothetical protein